MKKYLPICIIVLLSVVCLSIYGKEDKKEETNTIKENENKFTIAAYINGVYSDTMPTESKYFGYVECKDNSGNKLDTLGFVEWENNKWNVRITDITKASTCNIYFIDPPDHWLDAEEGTLLKAIKDNNKVENVRSIPAKQINKTDEALLSGTYDDYGTSYFFRGNVQNNYVQFANKCWKIVRITGDGSIKLFLWNNNGTDCTINSAPTTSKFNSNSTASSVGFMYGNPTATNYNDAQANITDSIILNALKQWYDLEGTFTSLQKAQLADIIWCGDKSGSGYGSGTYFMPRTRVVMQLSPSLICPNAGLDGKISKYTSVDIINGNGMLKTAIPDTDPVEYNYYKVGLITADEVAFAGGKYEMVNGNYFLHTGRHYWTMSPYYFFSDHGARVFNVRSNGKINMYVVSQEYSMYPSIALNYNAQATYNTTSEYEPGTVNNPYVVIVN